MYLGMDHLTFDTFEKKIYCKHTCTKKKKTQKSCPLFLVPERVENKIYALTTQVINNTPPPSLKSQMVDPLATQLCLNSIKLSKCNGEIKKPGASLLSAG